MYDYNQLSCFFSGQDLFDREQLYKTVDPIPVGNRLYKSGGFAGATEIVTVNSDNQKLCTMFFNSIYFNNEEDAEKATRLAHAEYGRYQQECADEWYSWRTGR